MNISRLTNRRNCFTVFKPEVEPIWTGNLAIRLGQKLDGNGDPATLTTTNPDRPLFWMSTVTWR